MALKPLNSVGGFSVGENPANVIAPNTYITSNGALFSGNLAISNANANWGILTDNLYYSNGTPWDLQLPAGSNTQVQFNSNGNFGASANFTFDTLTNLLTVVGNTQFNNANLGNLAIANFVNVASNLTVTGKSDLGNVGNVKITGGSANQYLQTDGTGNLTWTTADTSRILNGTSNVSIPVSNGNVEVSVGGVANVLVVSSSGANVTGTLGVSGNLSAGNANLGNLAEANFVNVSTNVNVTGTMQAGNVRTDNLLYANGLPWDLQEPAGSNTQIQYNQNNNFGASANFTYNDATQLFTVLGNGQFNNANLGNLATANFVNVASNLITSNLTVNSELSGNTANFSGNLVAPNITANSTVFAANANVSGTTITNALTVNTALTGNTANFSGNVVVPNLTVNLELAGNTANFSGNVVVPNLTVNNTLSGNIGNFTTVNTGNISSTGNLTLTSNGFSTVFDNTGNVSFSANAVITAKTFVGNIEGNLTITAPNTTVIFSDAGAAVGSNAFTFDKISNAVTLTGNLQVENANLGNLAYANYINAASNVTSNNVTVNLALAGNTANFSGNVIVPNLNVNLELAGNTANFTGNVVVPNLAVNLELAGNTANFTGNITSLNANLGNLAQANFVNVASNLHTVNANVTGTLEVANANISSNLTVNNLTVNLELAGNTANLTGNVVLSGAQVTVNNHLAGNTANFSGNITSLNANLGNLVDANFIRTGELMNGNSNIIIAPNGNISLSATGTGNVLVVSNVGANVTGYVTANGNGTFGALYSNTLTAQGGNLTIYAAPGDNYVEIRPTGNGQVDVGNHRITSLATPVASTDAATKGYVDAAVEGLHIHAPCAAATPDTLANISLGTITYNNGTAGVGANLVTTGSYTLIDGVNIASVGTRILVKDEANAAHNGIYTYANSTVLVRATDFDTPTEMAGGDFTFVQQGTIYNDTGWVMTDPVTTVGTTPVNFLQFSGAGEYSAGAGLTLTGTVFSVNVDNITTEIAGGNVVVKANAQLTTPNIGAATGTSLDLTGNLLAGNVNSNAKVTGVDFEASGNIIAANISANANLLVNNATINLQLSGNTANFTGNVVVNNFTTNLELTGNTANFSGAVITNALTANGNISANNVSVSNVTTTSALTVNNAITGNTANFSGNVIVPNLTVNLEVAGNTANFTGNVKVNNFTTNLELAGNTANFSGNVVVNNFVANGVANVGNLHVASNVTSALTPNANLTLDLGSSTQRWQDVYAGNIDASGNLTIAGNLASNNYTANIITANTQVNIGSDTAIRHANVTTTSITANQTISTVSFAGITGVEWLVKGMDSTGSKYTVAVVTAVTDGANVDYSVFGGVTLGSSTGTLAVNIAGSNIDLQVTPSSTNSTIWTTQYRTI